MFPRGRQGSFSDTERVPLPKTSGRRRPREGRRPRGAGPARGTTEASLPRPWLGGECAGRRGTHYPSHPVSLGERPTDPLPGTQGSPAGSLPLSSTLGALSPAPTHFRVQPPTSAPARRSFPARSLAASAPPNTSTERAASERPRETGARPCAAEAHARALFFTHALQLDRLPWEPSSPLLRVLVEAGWRAVIEPEQLCCGRGKKGGGLL